MNLGVPELLLIFGIALLLFGPKKLGQLGKGLGDGIRNFKSGLSGSSESDSASKPATPPDEGAPKSTVEEKK